MKKYFGIAFLVAFISVGFMSCQRDSGIPGLSSVENTTLEETSDYPAAIDTYIAANYPNATIDEVELEDGNYEVELSDGTELLFDKDGNFIKVLDDDEEEEEEEEEGTEVTDYPAAIDTYVGTNYPNSSIEEVLLMDDGTYIVELDDDTELRFDADGNFIEVVEDDDEEEEEGEEVTDYPMMIDDYLNTNYPNDTIDEVRLLDDGNYIVELESDIVILFDANGNFIEIVEQPVTEYPPAIDTYVATNHPDATIEEVILLSNGNYEVELSDGTEITFDSSGNPLP